MENVSLCRIDDFEELWGVIKTSAKRDDIDKAYYKERIKKQECYVYKDGAWIVGAMFIERCCSDNGEDDHAIKVAGDFILPEYILCGIRRGMYGYVIHKERELDDKAWFWVTVSPDDEEECDNLRRSGFVPAQMQDNGKNIYVRRDKRHG